MAGKPKLGHYVVLSVSYYRDDAVLRAGEAAEVLFTRSIAFAGEQPADGYITEHQARYVIGAGLKRIEQRIAALVRESLWVPVDGGWVVRSYVKWNRSAEEIGMTRKADRERKAAKREAERSMSDSIPPGIRPESDGIPVEVPDLTYVVGKEVRSGEVKSGQIVAPQADATAASTLIAEWIDHCSGGRPPSRVVGQVAREVGKMLDEGIPLADVRAGLAAWHAKGLHPSTLASVVHEVRTGADRKTQPKGSTTDERVAATLDLAARYAAAEGATLPAIGA
jgi:hypothetical protein